MQLTKEQKKAYKNYYQAREKDNCLYCSRPFPKFYNHRDPDCRGCRVRRNRMQKHEIYHWINESRHHRFEELNASMCNGESYVKQPSRGENTMQLTPNKRQLREKFLEIGIYEDNKEFSMPEIGIESHPHWYQFLETWESLTLDDCYTLIALHRQTGLIGESLLNKHEQWLMWEITNVYESSEVYNNLNPNQSKEEQYMEIAKFMKENS